MDLISSTDVAELSVPLNIIVKYIRMLLTHRLPSLAIHTLLFVAMFTIFLHGDCCFHWSLIFNYPPGD